MNTLKRYTLVECRVCHELFLFWHNGNICKPCHQAGRETPDDARWREALERMANEAQRTRKRGKR